jgi:hypothetical protein
MELFSAQMSVFTVELGQNKFGDAFFLGRIIGWRASRESGALSILPPTRKIPLGSKYGESLIKSEDF